MPATLLHEYFADAPYFRQHPGIIGAHFRIKGKEPYEPGLWFAPRPMKIEIATRVGDDFIDSGTREDFRRQYRFDIVDVQAGDAINDYYLPVRLPVRDNSSKIFRELYNAGALIHSNHIPRVDFDAAYELDEAGKEYRTKPFQIKFAAEDAFIHMPDETIEQIKQYSEVILKNGRMTSRPLSIFPGSDERLICGQPLGFFVSVALEMFQTRIVPHEIGWLQYPTSSGLSISRRTGTHGRTFVPNPYHDIQREWATALRCFSQAKMELLPAQQAALDAHVQDIRQRHAYFEKHPPQLG